MANSSAPQRLGAVIKVHYLLRPLCFTDCTVRVTGLCHWGNLFIFVFAGRVLFLLYRSVIYEHGFYFIFLTVKKHLLKSSSYLYSTHRVPTPTAFLSTIILVITILFWTFLISRHHLTWTLRCSHLSRLSYCWWIFKSYRRVSCRQQCLVCRIYIFPINCALFS